MTDKNLTAVLHAKKDLRLENTSIPEPGPGQIQVSMRHVGICGSDFHFYEEGTLCGIEIKEPYAIGHESAGVVSKLGEGVTSLKVGDKVALEPIHGCMACPDCKKGNYNLCGNVKICGVPPNWGSMTRFFVHNVTDCYKLPDHVSTEEGALMEPLSVAIHSCRRAGVSLGSNVLVLGDGKHDCRLSIAKIVGADFVFNVASKEPEEVAVMVTEAFGRKPEISIESTCVQSSIETAIFATHNGGNVTVSGVRETVVSLPIVNVVVREVDIRGVAANAHCFPIAIAMVDSGKVNLKPLITDIFALEQANEAFQKLQSKECLKVMIKCSKD